MPVSASLTCEILFRNKNSQRARVAAFARGDDASKLGVLTSRQDLEPENLFRSAGKHHSDRRHALPAPQTFAPPHGLTGSNKANIFEGIPKLSLLNLFVIK
jgi:hypothetical protein